MKPTLLVTTMAYVILAAVTHADPPELKAHRDAKTKQELKAYLDKQDANLEWRLRHFDRNQNGKLDPAELAAEKAAKNKQLAELQKRFDQREQARRAQGELTRWDRNRNGLLDPQELAAQRRHDEQVKQDLLKRQNQNENGKPNKDKSSN